MLVLVLLLVLHLALFRRHGIKPPESAMAEEASAERLGVFWPDQVLRDALACAAVLAVLLLLSWLRPAELVAPADPAEPFAEQRRLTQPHQGVVDTHENRIPDERENHRVGMKRADASVGEILQPRVELREEELEGNDDADQHAHNPPADGGQ